MLRVFGQALTRTREPFAPLTPLLAEPVQASAQLGHDFSRLAEIRSRFGAACFRLAVCFAPFDEGTVRLDGPREPFGVCFALLEAPLPRLAVSFPVLDQ